MKVERFNDGLAILADSTDQKTMSFVKAETGEIPLINCDPPYGNIVSELWDQINDDDASFASWMTSWTKMWAQCLCAGGAFYVWGGVGKPGFRPFFKYITQVEQTEKFELSNLITWKKKRGYGLSHNYLFVREELAFFINGNAKKPRMFNIPLLEAKRGYAGYNAKYPAKSEHYRRTNVWDDITEIMQGKTHPTEKKQRVMEIPIEVHTNPGEWVLDPFAGAGTTAFAARKLGRRFVIIEQNEEYFENCVRRLRET